MELRKSRYKYVASYKERIDSLFSYQKKLHEIISTSEKPEVQVRAISELHSIEMSVFSLFKELPQFDITPNKNTHTQLLGGCNCGPRNGYIMSHSKCRYCHQVWCPTTLNQNWCPNPDCSHGIKGSNFEPWDEHNKWIKCPTCEMWFKTREILDAHHCEFTGNPPAIEGYEGEEPLVHQDQVMPKPKTNEQPIPSELPSLCTVNSTSPSSPIKEQSEEEEQESEADRYWRNHPSKIKPNNNKTYTTSR